MGDRWGPAGPPEEAYSRVTDPERYRGLHRAARSLLTALEDRYDVAREEGFAPDFPFGADCGMVTLHPAAVGASDLAVIFTGFPGLSVNYGLDRTETLPACGCDACDETVPELTEQLIMVVQAVVGGTFGDALVRDGWTWWRESWLEVPSGGSRGRSRIKRDELPTLKAAMPTGEKRWGPWSLRG